VVNTYYDFSKADVVVSLDSDFLGAGPAKLRYSKDFAAKRRVRSGQDDMNRLYMLESGPNITTALADHILPLDPSKIAEFAFALAAKDAASNLFGSIALLMDRSVKVGEWVKIGSVEGVVEDVGMRTTKIRSFQKSLITVPNQVVANSPIENFSRRGIRRIKMNVGLTYGTESEQIKNIVQDIKGMLRAHKGISQQDTILVNFNSFGDSSLNIFIYAFTKTSVWARYLEILEDINLQIMHIVEKNGSGFAFPSHSVYIETMPKKGLE